jgi:fluoride exporter
MVGPPAEGGIPWHTLIVNLTGAFVLGLLLVIASRNGWPGWWRPLGVGLLGGYTTFSALSLEAADLLLRGSIPTAALYLGLSGLAAIGGALSGILVGRAVA